jgi:hypothetical protein
MSDVSRSDFLRLSKRLGSAIEEINSITSVLYPRSSGKGLGVGRDADADEFQIFMDTTFGGVNLKNHHAITVDNGNDWYAYPLGMSYSKIDSSNRVQASGESFPVNGTIQNLNHEDWRNAFLLYAADGLSIWFRTFYNGAWSAWSLIYSDSGWTDVTPINGWQPYGGDYGNGSYRKLGKIVFLEGLLKNGTANTVMFYLPAGYRPSKKLPFDVVSDSGTIRVDIFPDGSVRHVSLTGNGYVSLNGISFIVG